MRQFGRMWVGLLLVAAALSVRPAPAEDEVGAEGPNAGTPAKTEAAAATLALTGAHVDATDGAKRVVLALSRAPERVRSFTLPSPPRLVIDLDGPIARGDGREQRIAVGDDVVSRVRAARFENRLRVVVDLASKTEVRGVHGDGDAVVAELGSGPMAAAPAPVAVTHDAAPAPTQTARAAAPAAAKKTAKAVPAAALPDLVDAVAAVPSPKTVAATTATPPPAATAPVDVAAAPVVDAPPAAAKPAPTRLAMADPAPDRAVDVTTPAVEEPPLAARIPADVTGPARAAAETHLAQADQAAPPAEVGMPAAKPTRVARVEPVADTSPEAGFYLATAMPPPPADVPVAHGAKGLPKLSGVWRGQKISLDFKDADIQNVLRVLADVSNLNIIATDDVKGKVTLHLAEVPWDQALDLVLRTNRLEATQEGNIVRVSTVARLKEEREALRAAEEAQVELEPLRIAYYRVNYARADEALIDKVKGVLSDRGSVTFDDRTNTIIIRDIQRGINDAEQLIRELDVQSPQVLIEANIVEATEDFNRGLGVQWGYSYNGGPQTGTPTGSNFPGTIGVGGSGLSNGSNGLPFLADFPVPASFGSGFGPNAGSALDLALGSLDGSSTLTARLTALEEEGKGKVISRPRVVTMNNVAATIQSLTILRVKLPSTGTVINTGQGGAAGTATTATEKINTGITLVVTPQVSSDGFVLMNIYAKSSQPDFTRTVDGIPNEISREANSNVLIKTGETVVLGGIFRHTANDNESGIPFLRSVPGLGWLFKRTLDTKHQEELLVFLTPRIVDTGTAALPPAERLWQNRPGTPQKEG
jgi:type IV pilus assembly protein PilQ